MVEGCGATQGPRSKATPIEMIARSRRTIRSALLQAGNIADCDNTSSANAGRGCRRASRGGGSAASPGLAPTPQRPDSAAAMRASAAMAAMVVRAPMRNVASVAPMHPDRIGRGGDIDQRSRRDAAAPPLGEIGAGGAEFGRVRGGHGCRKSCGGPPFECGDQTVGPDRHLGQPDAGRVADGVGDRAARSARWRPRRCRRCRRARDRSRPRRNARRSSACRRCRECDSPPCRR